MSDPVTAAYVVSALAAAASVGVQYDQGRKQVQANQDAADANTHEQYRVAQEQERAAQAQASEQMTDRMREASRQLSVARVLDAEGGASFASQAINIQAGEDEDIARIGTSLKNAQSGMRDDMNAIRVSQKNANASFASQSGAIRARFLTEIGGTAANAYVGSRRRGAERVTAENRSSDYWLPTKVRLGNG